MTNHTGMVFQGLLILLLFSGCVAERQTVPERPPIIDMHLHAAKVADLGVGLGPVPSMCSSNEGVVWFGWDPRKPFTIEGASSCAGAKLAAATTDDDLLRQTVAILNRYNIRAVTNSNS